MPLLQDGARQIKGGEQQGQQQGDPAPARDLHLRDDFVVADDTRDEAVLAYRAAPF